MNWKQKAHIHRAVSLLPMSLSYAVHYWLQRRFGAYRRYDPTLGLTAGALTWKHIIEAGHDPRRKTFLEIGTGRVPVVPMAFWLMGASHTVTIDANPYLRPELLRDTIQFIQAKPSVIRRILGAYLDDRRFARLPTAGELADLCLDGLLRLLNITYIAPGNAARTDLPPKSLDFHTSINVFEHITPEDLPVVLAEGNRLLRSSGLLVHCIDYSDHFSHSDEAISPINFLQYSDEEWQRYAGNRYAYTNRLRHDDYLEIFHSVQQEVLTSHTTTNELSLNMLRNGGIELDTRFKLKPIDVLAVTSAWIISRPRVAA